MENNLRRNIANWKSIGASDTVLNWIEQGVKFPLIGHVNSFKLPNGQFTHKQEEFLSSEISNLLLLGCIERVYTKPAALMHLPNYLRVNGGTDSDTTLLMTSFAIANITGRLSGTFFNMHKNIDSLLFHIIFISIGGISTVLFPLYSQHKVGQFMFSILLGICCGYPNSVMTTLSIRFVGVSMLPEANGLSYFFCGIGTSGGSVVTGTCKISYVIPFCKLVVAKLILVPCSVNLTG